MNIWCKRCRKKLGYIRIVLGRKQLNDQYDCKNAKTKNHLSSYCKRCAKNYKYKCPEEDCKQKLILTHKADKI